MSRRREEIKRQSNLKKDIKTYGRLLSYLKRFKRYILFALICMILESWCQLFSIAMMKPVIDLIFLGEFIDMSKYVELYGSNSAVKVYDDGQTICLKINGRMRDKSAHPFVKRTCKLFSDKTKQIYIDISEVTKVLKLGWSDLRDIKEEAEQKGYPITMLLPDSEDVMEDVHKYEPAKMYTIATPEEKKILREKYFNSMELADPERRVDDFNSIEKIKYYLVRKFTPIVNKLQEYAKNRNNNFKVLFMTVCVVFVMSFFKAIFGFLNSYLIAYLGNLVVQKMRDHLYNKMISLDVNFFESRPVPELMSNVMTDVAATEAAVTVIFERIFKTPIIVINTLIMMILISPSLTFISLVVFPIAMYPLYQAGRKVRGISKTIQKQKSDLNIILSETFKGIRVVKAFNMEEHEIKKFEKENLKLFGFSIKTEIFSEIAAQITEYIGILALGAMLVVGGYFIIEKEFLAPTDFVLYLGLMASLFKPLKGMSKTNMKIQKGLAGADRVYAVIDTPPTVKEESNAYPLTGFNKSIEYKNVCFTYNGERVVLKDVNLTIPKGGIIAFVGETGSGKTSLVNLLPRFFDVTAGEITIDTHDIRRVTFESLRKQISIVTQHVILFDDTVLNNICYGHSGEVPMEKVIEAAKAANAHDFIMELEKDYDTRIGENGVKLSGGQRQRLAIARAILKDAPILIFDEATSALDSKTERDIQEAIDRMIVNRTTFIIAHRLSTILHAHEICVLDEGRIVERGTHEQLLQLGGKYADLYEIQFNPEKIRNITDDEDNPECLMQDNTTNN